MAASSSQDKIWYFEVTDPSSHPKGFTVYKVTAKVFPVHSPESLTEIVIWKRYNDFKQLYKAMNNLHKSLHRREEFPNFAKPKLFGRFDELVIEERRASALDLLNFIGRQSHLYRSQLFSKFLEGGKVLEGLSGQVLKPSRLDILGTNPEPVIQPVLEPAKLDVKVTTNNKQSDPTNSLLETLEADNSHNGDISEPVLEGVWQFPQVPDNISLNSYDDDTDVDSTLGTPLPESDMSFFDPLAEKDKTGQGTLHTSKSWIMEAVNTCAELETDGAGLENHSELETSTDLGLQMRARTMDSHTDSASDTLTRSSSSFTASTSTLDVSEFDPLTQSIGSSGSKVRVGKGDLDISQLTSGFQSGSSSSLDSASSNVSTPQRKVPKPLQSVSPGRQRSVTKESVSTMDLGSKEDYIYLAASQICQAKEFEANGNFEQAFATYKSCVGILLQGVQTDTNKSRRDAVRRKTAQYLMKAEDLYNRYLAKEASDEQRWVMDSTLSPSTEVDPSLTFVRGPASDLKKFKVLGTINKVILVFDRSTEETFIVKRIYKSCTGNKNKKNILPTSCPYMVQLHKFYETPHTIYLLLQYASGGKLWDYVGAYLRYAQEHAREGGPGSEDGYPNQNLQNVYAGYKIHTDDNKCKSFNTETPKNAQEITKDESVVISDQVVFSKENNDVIIGNNVETDVKELSVEDFQLDISEVSTETPETNTEHSPVENKVQYNRFTSFSSEENVDDEGDNAISSPAPLDRQNSQGAGQFQDILQKNSKQGTLENFSINSFDSSDGFTRVDSNVSDVIQVIHEVHEPSCDNEVFSDVKETNDSFRDMSETNVNLCKFNDVSAIKDHIQDQNIYNDYNLHISNPNSANGIELHSAEKLTGGEFNTDIFSQNKVHRAEEHSEILSDDIINNSRQLLRTVERTLSQIESDTRDHVISQDYTSNGAPASGDCPEEPSIYELHGDNSDSQSDSKSQDFDTDQKTYRETSTDNPSVTHCSNNVPSVNIENTIDSKTDNDQMSRPDSITRSTSELERNKRKPSLTKLNSTEISRSASFDYKTKSPGKARQRTISAMFEQLDVSSKNPEQVRIPESFIKRELKPDNILLGDQGHATLTYFYQINQVDDSLDFDAIHNLYVAPEVNTIAGYTEACDWWSLGVLLYELLVGKTLLMCHPGGITSHTQLNIPDHLSKEARSLLTQLLVYNVRERLGSGLQGVEEIKTHPFFTGIDWNGMEI